MENYQALIDRAVQRNVIAYDPKAPVGVVTPKLLERLAYELRSYFLTDVHVRGEYLTPEIFQYIIPRSINVNWHLYSNKVWDKVEEYAFEHANDLRAAGDVSFIIGQCNERDPYNCDLNKEVFKVILGSY